MPGLPLHRHPVLNSGGDASILYTTEREIPRDIDWCQLVIKDTALQEHAVDIIERLLTGTILEFEGGLAAIGEISDEIERVLLSMTLSPLERWSLMSRCSVRLDNGKLSKVESRRSPFYYTPSSVQRIIADSMAQPTYAPAYLFYTPPRDIFGLLGHSEWLHQRFVSKSATVPLWAIGNALIIEPKVFVPDPLVLDLLLGAYCDKDSPLRDDLQNAIVSEPCTGSGILAILAVALGARRVIASDIDVTSVSCAKANVARLNFSDKVIVKQGDALDLPDRGDILLVNPPWYGSVTRLEEGAPAHVRRCLEDEDHVLLRRLLLQAVTRVRRKGPAYIFVGEHDPLGSSGNLAVPLDTLGWQQTHRWLGPRQLRLYRALNRARSSPKVSVNSSVA